MQPHRRRTVGSAAPLTAVIAASIELSGCLAPAVPDDPGSTSGQEQVSVAARPAPSWSDPGAAPTVTRALAAGLPQLETDGAVRAGTYRHTLGLGYEDPVDIVLTVPAGWSVRDGRSLLGDQGRVAVSFWNVFYVYADSCRWRGALHRPGPGVADLVAALVEVPGRGQTQPADVFVDGRWGLYLEWSVPADLTFDREHNAVGCDPESGFHDFRSWLGDPGAGARSHQGPGQLDRLWVLDVDGRRLVIDASQMPGAAAEKVAQADAIVRSVRFVGG